ncbi:MAG: hypothetical protein Kow0022_00860 [Phycisphaerales bacterium]
MAQTPAGSPSASQAWSPPTSEVVTEQLEEVRQQIEALGEGAENAGLKSELERLVGILERERVLVTEYAAPHEDGLAGEAQVPDGSITIQQLDQLKGARNTAITQSQASQARLVDARKAVERSLQRVAEAESRLRAAREGAGDAGAESVALAEARLKVAQAELNVRRMERLIAERESALAEARSQRLSEVVAEAAGWVVFTSEQLNDILVGLDRSRLDIEGQLQRAQSNLEFANERLLAARRRLDEQGGRDVPGLNEEVAARSLWRETFRRESEILAKSIERSSIQKEVWEIRFRLWNDTEYRRSGEAAKRLREIQDEVERSERLLSSRLEESRAQLNQQRAARQADQAEPTSDPQIARWRNEAERAVQQLIDVLEQERARIADLSQLTALALEDAVEADRHRSLLDMARSVWNAVAGVWQAELFVVQERSITVGKLTMGLVLLVAGLWIARAAARTLGRTILPRLGLDEGAAAAIEAILFYVLLVTIALFALRMINIPLTVFTVLGGGIAIGIGFGSQNLMNNFISGLILLAERPIRVGDLIEVGELHGIVQHIGARSTRVLTPNNIDIIVPNSSFLESNVTNWTLTEDRVRTSVRVGVAYGSPTREVIKLMRKAAEDHGKVLDKPAPIVLFEEFGDNALIFELIFWIRMKRMLDRRMIESDLRLRINELFKDAHITVAFPQRDVHLDTLTPLAVKVMGPHAEQPSSQDESSA